MKSRCERLETLISSLRLDYVRIEEQLDGHLSVFVRELREDPPRRQFEIQFRSFDALRVTREHVDTGLPDCRAAGAVCLVVDSPWISEVNLEANSFVGFPTGHMHCVVFTESFTVEVATKAKPRVREVAELSDDEFRTLTSQPSEE